MAAALPNFDKFPVHADEATTGTRWKKWHARFENMLAALEITDDTRKKALMLHYAGEEVYDIYDSFTDAEKGDAKAYGTTVESLKKYFDPKKNIDFETFKFRQCKQESGESVDSYYTRLRTLGLRCEFADIDREIKGQILQGTNSARLRRRALREADMKLDKLLEAARALEISDTQAKQIEGETVNAVKPVQQKQHTSQRGRGKTRYKGKKSHSQRETTQQAYTSHRENGTQQGTCGWCGGDRHPRNSCPAKDKVCGSCSKIGHFSKACRSKNYTSQKTASVRNIRQEDRFDAQDSTDEEYVFGVSNNTKSAPRVHIQVYGESVPFLIDTGASVNIVDEQTYERVKPAREILTPVGTSIYAYGTHTPLQVLGKFCTDIAYKDDNVSTSFFVVRSGTGDRGGNLLSSETAQKLNLINFAFSTVSQTVADTLCAENKDLFEGIGLMKDVKVKLYVDESVQPTVQPHRRIPYHMRKKVENELQRLESLDIIEKVDGPTPWVSPIVVAPKPKKPDEIRLCIDMRLPNTAIKRTRHIMPTIDDIIMQLNQSTVFSKLDLTSGYHQLELDNESRHMTTFSTHVGLRRYKRLNFGVTSAAEIFQNHIAEMLTDIPGAFNISDDIMIHGKTQEEHDTTLKKVFARLREKNLTLNKAKCEFNKDSIEFYGCVFSADGMSPDPKKVKAVQDASPPTNAKEVRSFLGLTNYVSRFVPDYANITKPLRELTHKNAEWRWTSEHESAVRELKSRLTSSKVMAYYDPALATEIVVDASPHGIGGLLSQRDKNDVTHIVAYASRALTDVESRYSQTEREALAVVWACEHFHLYLYGHPFCVFSDHKPLEGIYNNATSRTSARIERWNLRLQSYDFTLRYRPGESNPADFLSRHPVLAANAKTTRESKIAEEYVNFLVDHTVPKAMTLSEIAKETRGDPTLQAVMRSIQFNQWHPPQDISVDQSSFKILKTVRDELSISDDHDIILRGTQIVLPRSLQQRAVDLAHEGHQGIIKTKRLIREKVWFPHIDRLVENKVKSCLACLSTTPDHPSEPLKMTELPDQPWSEVSIDFAGPFPSGDYLMVVIDAYSRYPEVEVVKSTSAKAVIPKLDAIFARHGIPDIVKSDNGPPFNGHEFGQFATYLGFKHRKVTPLWPQANGGVEKCMSMLKKTIQAAQIEKKVWRQELYKYLRNYRATPHSSTNVSPAEALFGRKMKTKLPEVSPQVDLSSTHAQLDRQIRQQDAVMKEKMKNYADNRRRAAYPDIQVGDTVLVRQRRENKLTPYYAPTPIKVEARKGSMLTAGTGERQITRNSSFFKKVSLPTSHETVEENNPLPTEDDVTDTTTPTDGNRDVPGSSNPGPVRVSQRDRRAPTYLKDYVT